MNERIKEARKKLGLTQEQFADKLGLKRNTIATYETGVKNPSERTISDICRVFNINEEWLKTGKGNMEKPKDDKLAEYLADVAKGNDEFIQSLVEVYYELDPTSREALKMIAHRMADKIKGG